MTAANRRRIAAIAVLIALACTMFSISFFTGLVMEEKPVSSTDTFSDELKLETLANKTFSHTVQKTTVLTLYASADAPFETTLLYNGRLTAAPKTGTSVRNSYMLLEIGDYTIRFNNTGLSSINLTYTVTFVETENQTEWALLWLRWPIFAFGLFLMLLTIPTYMSPQIGRLLKNKYVKASIVIACVVLILFNYQITGLVLRTSTPWVIAQGISMEPNLHGGDLVIIEGTPVQNLEVGNIVLYDKFAINTTSGTSRKLQTAVLHRIIDSFFINGHWYFAAKGDNNPTPDESLVPEDGISGKAVYVVPNLGLAVAFLTRTETKIILLTILVLSYFVVPELKSEFKKRKTKTTSPSIN